MFRWIALIILGSGLAVSGWHRSRARRSGGLIPRSREGVPLMVGRALGALLLFGSVLMYIIDPRWMAWAAFDAAQWLRWAGAGLGVVAVSAAHWTLAALGPNVSETVLTKDGQELVTHGPYRWVRHPLYTAGITLFLASGLVAANWFILAAAFAALISIRCVVIPLEEQSLLARFGEDYVRYRATTGAMLPAITANRAINVMVLSIAVAAATCWKAAEASGSTSTVPTTPSSGSVDRWRTKSRAGESAGIPPGVWAISQPRRSRLGA